jgi:hypothetical protein
MASNAGSGKWESLSSKKTAASIKTLLTDQYGLIVAELSARGN